MTPRTAASALVLIALLTVGGSVSARENDDAVALALGDSVAFGFITQAGYEYGNPDNFVGFPDYVGGLLRLDVVNASCPGETTSGFLSATGDDNGCRPYRANFPLHVGYGATQRGFATTYLRRHHNVRLVTITLGANDGLLLQRDCASDPNPALCIQAGLPALLARVAMNMQTILGDLRETGYRGVIVVTNYYSPNYADAAGTALIAALNAAIVAPADSYGAAVADLFTAFGTATNTPIFAGNSCRAGLLNASPQNQFLCDVHPSQSGHRLIARAVSRAAQRSRW